MSNKTPFEIRLELLKMAKEMLENEYFQKTSLIDRKYEFDMEEAQRKGLPCPERKSINYPTEEEVIKKANSLNKFISNG